MQSPLGERAIDQILLLCSVAASICFSVDPLVCDDCKKCLVVRLEAEERTTC